MKIRILIKENLDKIYNILPIIKKNRFLKSNVKNIEYYNEENWTTVFNKVVKDMKEDKKFERLCIFDEDGMLPFIFFSKEIGFIAAAPYSIYKANLCRAHNNANCIIMSTKYVKLDDMNNILSAFFVSENDGGRHATRVRLMQGPYKKTNKTYEFNPNCKDTVVMCSDHAGFAFKEAIKDYLTKEKHLKVIDVGCSSLDSSHYPLFTVAMILNANKAMCGIGFCSTGVGIANTANNFKGINAFMCALPGQAKLARSKYDANVLALGASQLDLKSAKAAVDEFISTPRGESKFMKAMDDYGYDFDKEAFKKIEIESNVEIPKELQ